MTCDDNGSFPPEEPREKRRELKRTLDVQQTFDANSGNENLIENKIMKTTSSEELIRISTPNTKKLNQASLVNEHDGNTEVIKDDSIIINNYSRQKKKRLEIETEFRTLQSLIPKIANKQPINEVRNKI